MFHSVAFNMTISHIITDPNRKRGGLYKEKKNNNLSLIVPYLKEIQENHL